MQAWPALSTSFRRGRFGPYRASNTDEELGADDLESGRVGASDDGAGAGLSGIGIRGRERAHHVSVATRFCSVMMKISRVGGFGPGPIDASKSRR